MKRRQFFQTTGTLAAGMALPDIAVAQNGHPTVLNPIVKPRQLREGSVIALIAPGSPISDAKLEQALQNMLNLGFSVKEGRNIRQKYGYLAGSDEQRLADLHWAFSDPEVEAVWCVRGGYGCGRLLPKVDFDLIRRNPKVLIGYSDITALHLAIHHHTGLVSFHGPVAASDYPDNTVQHLRSVLLKPESDYILQIPDENAELPGNEFKPYVITPGVAKGPLTGGNLSLLSAMAGTPHLPSFAGKIVFIEDIGEQPYRIDRMLIQMLQSTDLAQAAGIALGVFYDCNPKPGATIPTLTLEETLRDCFGSLGMPVLYGLPFGHVAHNATLPYGTMANLNTEKGTLTLIEKSVH
jgi:muramoyltetrapeptide carboxypeptidase